MGTGHPVIPPRDSLARAALRLALVVLVAVAAGALLSIPGAIYAVVKTAFQAITGRPAKGRVWTVLDVVAEVLPNLPGAINRAVRGAGLPSIFSPPSTPTPPPSDPQRGAVRVGALLAIAGATIVATVLGAALNACTPPPPSDGGTPVVTPSEWTRTARIATTAGRGLIPVAQTIVEATTTDPGRTQARRAFVAADAALAGLDRALDAYDARGGDRGGDRCAAHAAAGAAVVALTELAEVLAANGIALGVPLGRVVDLVGSVVDTLVPACNLDAGWASAGRAANSRLLGIERDARSRGVILRRDLDRITPALDGGVR